MHFFASHKSIKSFLVFRIWIRSFRCFILTSTEVRTYALIIMIIIIYKIWRLWSCILQILGILRIFHILA